MFNLNQALAAWRRQMADAGITSAQVLDELESHLRDAVEEQVRAGADTETAFDSAIQRLGPPAALRAAFAIPAVAARGRRFWPIFYYACAAVAILADLATLIVLELSAAERAIGGCAVAALAWYLLRRPFLPWWHGGLARARLLAAMKALGILLPLWILWSLLTALRWAHLDIGFVPTLILWSVFAAYGLTVLACGISDRQGSGGSGSWLPPLYPVPVSIPPRRPCPPGWAIAVPPADSFTPVARQALDLAREEALRLGHDFIGTEHVLLGVLRSAGDALGQALERHQVRGDTLRREIERLVAPWPARPTSFTPPLTPRARKALQFARAEAAALKDPLIRPEHVLLGLLREGSGVAALALRNLGVQLKALRAEFPAI